MAVALTLCAWTGQAWAQDNLLANPGVETLAANGFPADWGRGEHGKEGEKLFVETNGVHSGGRCLRLVGTPNSFTTCAAATIPVKPETTYWITWWWKAKQPETSRTYVFLHTNQGQRTLGTTSSRYGDFDWELCMVSHKTKPGETSLYPVLTMQSQTEAGTSWWDDLGVWETLPPDLEAVYQQRHPWGGAQADTARRLARTDACTVWIDRPEARIYPKTPAPPEVGGAAAAGVVTLTAPGRGHDLAQLILSPTAEMAPVSLRFTAPSGPGPMPASTLSYRVARCVPVKEVRDTGFPLGPTPDPLVVPTEPEPVRPGENAILWVEWAPPAGGEAGIYTAEVEVLSGGKPIATVPLRLRRWGFDLPEVPLFRSMVYVGVRDLRRFYPGKSDEEAYPLGWEPLAAHRLSAFNMFFRPEVSLEDLKLAIDWTSFDRALEAAKRYRATAITIGPMLGGANSVWAPHKFAGLTPLVDPAFDALYVELNRQMASRLRAAGLFDRSYVYPIDEPNAKFMDKVARLCDLIHQGDPELKVLMCVSELALARPLYGKVKAWILTGGPSPRVEERRAAGDEIWIYNMTAAIESAPAAHRTYMWRALSMDARGGLLWQSTHWRQVNPWENPTPAPYPRKNGGFYYYQSGQAMLFYPDPEGKGPLVPALRLPLIRQGVEDFDIVTALIRAWQQALPRLDPEAGRQNAATVARAALVAPVVLGGAGGARVEALRLIAGNMLEVASQAPAVIAYPVRSDGRLEVAGWAEKGTQLTLDGSPVPLRADGSFSIPVGEDAMAAGIRWAAAKGRDRKSWEWPGLR